MSFRFAAVAALIVGVVAALPAPASERISLDDAFQRVASTHPDLRLFGPRRDVLSAELERASLRPGYVARANVENALGTGVASGVQGLELTLSLASVFERGGKLDARRTLGQSRIDGLAVEREARRLDLLAEVARRYLAAVAAQRQREIAQFDIAQRQRTVAGARKRLQAGASPESVVLTAQAALARAELDLARADQRSVAARQHLAALWGARAPDIEVMASDPLKLPAIADFGALTQLLDRTPELTQFVGEQRIREARLQLARSEAKADLSWDVGLRRLQATGDFGFVAGISMPLSARGRAQPGIRAADAELASLEIEREAKGLSLYSTLADAHGRYRVAQLEVSRMQSEILPKLANAEAAAERAYRAGAISYLEWAQLQSERTLTRKQQLDAALDAQRALIEIQRLTGEAFVVGSEPSTEPQGHNP
ncbi:MAG: TolC family protein [Thermomonas sp.]